MSGWARPELLATTDWLADQLERPDVRILDVRWRPDGTGDQVHAAGHIPGAIHLDWTTALAESTDETGILRLAGPELVAGALGKAGIGDGASVVVYDDTASLFAARTWWSLRAFGLESCRILDGGFAAWTAEGRPVSHARIPPEATVFTPRAQSRVRLTTADVGSLLGSPDATIVDARSPSEHRGLEGDSRRLGRIPGSHSIPAAATTRPGDQRFRSADELRALLRRADVGRDRRFVCYDAAGIGAAKVAFVLMLLGYDDVAVYDGGWAEWGDRLDLPVER
jgi:thiosulfate/3-mercaptopyruvate sulfurtransferase